ncbi:MAG: glycosyltransferase [Saprospiraceae bacterium]
MSLKIGMVVDSYYPKDIRVRKEAESLALQNEVYVLCVRDKNQKEEETINNVHVYRLIEYKNSKVRGFLDMINSLWYIHPIFIKKLEEFVEKTNVEVLHVHDLPLAKTGYKIAKKHNLPAILDLHENYPEALKTWFIWRKSKVVRLKNKLFFNYKRWHSYEQGIIGKYDVIIAVVKEMKNRLVTKQRISPDKIVVVSNTEKKDFANVYKNINSNVIGKFADKFVISYVGGFGPHRGLDVAIEGMVEVSKQIKNAILLLVGPSNKDVREYLQGIIDNNNLGEYVKIIESQPFNSVAGIMKMSDINIIPHVKNEHTNNTVPHKLFQILLSGETTFSVRL